MMCRVCGVGGTTCGLSVLAGDTIGAGGRCEATARCVCQGPRCFSSKKGMFREVRALVLALCLVRRGLRGD
ncbi:hypothetical protein K461DRAFT_183382 [Myriangium duriaei CBS 260.36]|uniref:Uncharacterized protein n=1 Tax=Myriangium duriaei CBS 260.36 TaxID=1168546 RepID=A0A9P4IWA9_9PEZI|nr:hypothetical protein K461DRAFT_183382 [Myriangium duriaei CBS 260.36]